MGSKKLSETDKKNKLMVELFAINQHYWVNYYNPLIMTHFGAGFSLLGLSFILNSEEICMSGLLAMFSLFPTSLVAVWKNDSELLELVKESKK
ncbi:MAG: hypothetical protein JKX76_01975 [Colwellia sp.]|nr:hypothetical protein [Colwellia sp.]